MITAREIIRLKEQRTKERNKTYETFLRRACERIKTSAMKTEENFVTYNIPQMIWGHPLYDVNLVLAYLHTELQKLGFQTKTINQQTILISWTTNKSSVSYTPKYRPTVYDPTILNTIENSRL